MIKIKKHRFINISNFFQFLTVLVSFFVAICLSILPIPLWMSYFWPLLPVLVLIFLVVYLPNIVGSWFVWFIGLMLDIIQGSILGEHALAFILVYYFSCQMNRQIKGFSLLTEIVCIAFILLIYQGTIILCENIPLQHYILFIFPLLTSLILWPSLFWIMRRLYIRYI